MAPKSVCVVSVEVGPRSLVLGGAEAESGVGVVEMARAWLRRLLVCRVCGERRLGMGQCGAQCKGRMGGYRRRGKASVALRARRRGMLGVFMAVPWRSGFVVFFTCEYLRFRMCRSVK